MSLARSFLKGKRFAFRESERAAACERCVFGTGEHAEWCPERGPMTIEARREANEDLVRRGIIQGSPGTLLRAAAPKRTK